MLSAVPLTAAWGFDVGLDLFPMLAGVLAAVSCALAGNFLVLRRLSLMGDAISHSVLPGLVLAFLISATRDPLVMFVGAALAGVLTVALVELIKKIGRVEPGAAMGVVFCSLFALGVLLMEQAAADHVDLDAECVLHGQLESLAWYSPPATWAEAFQLRTWTGYAISPEVIDPETGHVLSAAVVHEGVPRQVVVLAVVCLIVAVFVIGFLKELGIAAFDPALATTLGFNAGLMHYALMVAVAAATVASFEAVGSVLVIAMLICPAATARLLTDRLRTQVILSTVIALACSVLGYLGATAVPALFGKESVSAAGSMAVACGVLLAIAALASPSHGVIVRAARRRRLARSVAIDDLLAKLYRWHERGVSSVNMADLQSDIVARQVAPAVAAAVRGELIKADRSSLKLTTHGLAIAKDVVRRHRLWEVYLVDRAGVSPDHVHDTAEQLEHVRVDPPDGPDKDPHGKHIPNAP